MTSAPRLTLLGGLAYLFFLLLTIPASTVYDWVSDEFEGSMPALQLYDIKGSIWDGEAARAVFRKREIGSVKWQLNWLPLLTGSAAGEISIQTESGFLQGGFSTPLGGGSTEFEALKGQLTASEIQSLLPYSHISIDGMLGIDLQGLKLSAAGRPVSAFGQVHLYEVNILSPAVVKVGDVDVQFNEGDDNGLQAEVRDRKSPLDIEAMMTLSESGQYTVSGTISAKDSKDESLTGMLSLLGKPDRNGAHRINLRGSI